MLSLGITFPLDEQVHRFTLLIVVFQFILRVGALALQLTVSWQVNIDGLKSGDMGKSARADEILHRNAFSGSHHFYFEALEVFWLADIVAVIGFSLKQSTARKANILANRYRKAVNEITTTGIQLLEGLAHCQEKGIQLCFQAMQVSIERGRPAARLVQFSKPVMLVHIFHNRSQVAIKETSRHQPCCQELCISKFSAFIKPRNSFRQEIIQKTINCNRLVCHWNRL